jgi:tRNA dimethylallyltransferase
MKNTHKAFRQLAIIGSTASGKTSLGIKVAQKIDAYILSLDSLSIYKDINIVSAKPTLKERDGVKHFGIDVICPDESFDVTTFMALYKEVYHKCLQEGKNLVIVGGTSFYLKMLLEGISELPSISDSTKEETNRHLQDLPKAYALLDSLDPQHMTHIENNDSYRVEKALNIFLETGLVPSEYFRKFPPKATITEPLPIYQIVWEREVLRERIALRTNIMLSDGLVDEVCMLEKKYGRKPKSMQSIGIKETLAYLDGVYDKKMLIEKISTNTARLAKRQNTFNNSQFEGVTRGSVEELERVLL